MQNPKHVASVSEREVRENNERIPRTRIFARALALFSLFARERESESESESERETTTTEKYV